MTRKPLVATREIEIEADPSKVWEIIVSPAYWPKWMEVQPVAEPQRTSIDLDSQIRWENDRGDTYLTGTVTTLERVRRLVLELDDVSWERRPAPGEVTYSLTLTKHGPRTHVAFRLGDLSIDPHGAEWCQTYLHSRELERIRDLAKV